MEGRKSRRILSLTLVGLVLLIIGLVIGIVMDFNKTESQLADFNDEIYAIHAELDSIFFSDDSTTDPDNFISILLIKIEKATDPDQKLQLAVAAADFYYFSKEYGLGIAVLANIDTANCTVDNQLLKIETLFLLYDANGDALKAKEQAILVSTLPDMELQSQDMSIVKERYSKIVEGLNE